MTSRLIVVLGDQLTPGLASLRDADKTTDVVVMGEVGAEAGYANHHKKKLIFVFSAMRHFAEELRADGWRVDYARLDEDGFDDLTALIDAAVIRRRPAEILVTAPGEHRVAAEIAQWSTRFDAPVRVLEDDRFLASNDDFAAWAKGKKALRMEYFYRAMRRKTGLLMDGDEPAGGQWNFDADNRKPAPDGLKTPPPLRAAPDAITRDVAAMVKDRFPDNFGDGDDFWFAVTRSDAEAARDYFIERGLPIFGDYQDAMASDNPFLAHSLLALYINIGLLDPLDVCARAERAYTDGRAPINAVEGFIRQIIGWREFIRGVYFHEGPGYVERNELGADLALPSFYWTGDTDMACVRAAVEQTRSEAYAHHIQRLMVTGVFALIAGINPYEVHKWYLGVYADAYEWVEAPNTIGMALFADGGVVASKPYAASGAYINRMSNYSKSCRYKVAKKTEDDACPFNALYWDFLLRHEESFSRNPRVSRAYQTWRRMGPEKQQAYRARAAVLRDAVAAGGKV